MRKSHTVVLLAVVLLPAAAAAAEDGGGLPSSGPLYEASLRILFKLFIVAAVLEQALALLFNWKLFREYLDERATKPLVAFAVAAFPVWWFGLNLLSDLLRLYAAPGTSIPADEVVSGVLTALILGGGSSAVNNLLTTLGLRPVREPPATMRPVITAAWVAVKVSRVAAVGTVTVMATDALGVQHALGTVDGAQRFRVASFFLRDAGRFPPSGGHVLAPGTWSILLQGRDKGNVQLTSAIWGPYQVDAGSLVNLGLAV